MAWHLLFHYRDGEEAEAIAMLEGLCFAGRWSNNTPLQVESKLNKFGAFCRNLLKRQI
jgi:hypothetical protein